jgi:hypothetical protein
VPAKAALIILKPAAALPDELNAWHFISAESGFSLVALVPPSLRGAAMAGQAGERLKKLSLKSCRSCQEIRCIF